MNQFRRLTDDGNEMTAVTIEQVASLTGGTIQPGKQETSEVNPAGVELTSFTHDSRQVASGGLFACVRGESFDGHAFASQAIEQGATALLVEHQLVGPVEQGVPQILVPDVRMTLGPLADLIYGQPSDSLITIGVTGTSGKTTIVHLLESVLSSLGVLTESIGTLTGARTTPEAPELQATIADMVKRGIQALAMEVSSHALTMGRVAGTRFDISIFTNLGHDHLDFHLTMEAYLEAKATLFDTALTKVSVLNRDDEAGQQIARTTNTRVLTYGLTDAEGLKIDGPTSTFVWRGNPVRLNLAGEYNVMNALAVATAVEALGHDQQQIAQALSAVNAPAGRFEVIASERSFHLAVDYAHKPEALGAALRAARQIAGQNRVIVVFGCGGDRDRGKRPLMGKIAGENADVVVVTSDNPRSESPDQIIKEIVDGLQTRSGVTLVVEPDRLQAISAAIDLAKDGDFVLLAGKGHETYQEINGERRDFDDRLIALELLEASQ